MTRRSTTDPRQLAGRAGLLLVVLLIAACSSSPHSTTASTAGTAGTTATIASTCQQVTDVLGDGPDPDADPVGFAEAHIFLLRQIRPPDQALRGALSQLADANQSFVASNGKSANAKEAIAVASKKINSVCPGAAS